MKQKGFTLVELMVVMAVIAILASTALVAFTGVQKTARDTTRKSNIGQYRTALENYYAANQYYPSTGMAALNAALIPSFIPTALTDPAGGGARTYLSSPAGVPIQYVLYVGLETGGYWEVCDSATQGGKAGKVIAVPTDSTCDVT